MKNSGYKYSPLGALIMLLFILVGNISRSQDTGYSNYLYRIYLKDKGLPGSMSYSDEDILSPRAISRRAKNFVTTDMTDLPVYKPYIDSVKLAGYEVRTMSKWMNTLVIESPVKVDYKVLTSKTFIDTIILVRPPVLTKNLVEQSKSQIEESLNEAPPYYWQILLNNGTYLHENGYNGDGQLIAVLDGGFRNSDLVESLEELRQSGRIKYTYDYVTSDPFVWDYSYHGTDVLTILAANLPGSLKGSAPGADYMLFRTEDVYSEYPVEEDFWVAAAEYADSAGADIISTSLGYFIFDDSTMSYSYDDMDGESTFIARAAQMAFSKGIVVVASAGNERDDPWQHIISPSDARGVIATGAVDANNEISGFSSAGPSSDGRIKPDVVALGVSVSFQKQPGSVSIGNGTSFSCPIISGLTACLMEAYPSATAIDISEALRISGDRNMIPDSLYGYGLANFHNAWIYLSEVSQLPDMKFKIYPNPAKENLYFRINDNSSDITIEIFNMEGKRMYLRKITGTGEHVRKIEGFSSLPGGIFIIRASSGNSVWRNIIIKIE